MKCGTGIAEVMVSNPVESPEFFRFMRPLLKLSSKCETKNEEVDSLIVEAGSMRNQNSHSLQKDSM